MIWYPYQNPNHLNPESKPLHPWLIQRLHSRKRYCRSWRMNINPCSRELVGIQWAWHGSIDFLFLCVVVNGAFFPSGYSLEISWAFYLWLTEQHPDMFRAFETRRWRHAFYCILHNHSSCFAYVFFQHGDVTSFKIPSIVVKQMPSPKTNIAPARRPSLKRKLFYLPTKPTSDFLVLRLVFRGGTRPKNHRPPAGWKQWCLGFLEKVVWFFMFFLFQIVLVA